MKLFLFLIAFASLQAFSADDIYEYRAKHFPGDAEECAAGAAEIGKKLTAATGVKIYLTRCEKGVEEAGSLNAVVFYIAPEKLNRVSTTEQNFGLPEHLSKFEKLADCVEALPAEIKTFETYTGVKAVAAYCYDEGYLSPKWRFVVNIDGFGEPKLKPIVMGTALWGKVVGDMQPYSTELSASIKALGDVPIAYFVFEELLEYRLTIHYYGKKWRSLKTAAFVTTDTVEHCTSQLDAARAAMKKSAKPPLVTLCINHRGFEIKSVLDGNERARSVVAPDRYVTWEECQAAQPKVEKYYLEVLKKKVLGSLCGGREEAYSVTVLEAIKGVPNPFPPQ